MVERPYDLARAADGVVARVRLRGSSVLSSPLLNRGTAFTLAEREALGLTGLLPKAVSMIEGQLARVYGQYVREPGDLAKNLYLANLRDRNEVLFYRLLTEHLAEMLPIGVANARRILTRYAGTCCTFNDDMQGTAAVVVAAALCAARAAGTAMRDQTVVIHGAGTAGVGIANALRQVMIDDGLPAAEAASRFYALDSRGLLTSDYPGALRDFQVPYARSAAEVAGWQRDADGGIGPAEVVARGRPTMLFGTSTQPGAFSEAIVTEMAAHTERPVIMPLANPTTRRRRAPPYCPR